MPCGASGLCEHEIAEPKIAHPHQNEFKNAGITFWDWLSISTGVLLCPSPIASAHDREDQRNYPKCKQNHGQINCDRGVQVFDALSSGGAAGFGDAASLILAHSEGLFDGGGACPPRSAETTWSSIAADATAPTGPNQRFLRNRYAATPKLAANISFFRIFPLLSNFWKVSLVRMLRSYERSRTIGGVSWILRSLPDRREAKRHVAPQPQIN